MSTAQLLRLLLTLTLFINSFAAIGCNDGFRQTMVPKLFDGLNLIADGLLEAIENCAFPEATSDSDTST